MNLPQTAEYALRVMAQLSLLPPKETMRVSDLSKKVRIPVPFLSKFVRRLAKRGLVSARRGCGGGVRVARPPREIRYLDILEAAGYKFEVKRCVFGWGRNCGGNNP